MPAFSHLHVAGKSQDWNNEALHFRLYACQKPASRDQRDDDTYSSCVQLEGLSMRWPSFNSLKSSSTGIPGYGEPPNVKISHIKTPKDQL